MPGRTKLKAALVTLPSDSTLEIQAPRRVKSQHLVAVRVFAQRGAAASCAGIVRTEPDFDEPSAEHLSGLGLSDLSQVKRYSLKYALPEREVAARAL